ncbi:MAG: hypothetical protein ACREUE_05695 [Panacagrimonas sp.]
MNRHLVLALVLAIAAPAHAYMGPGAGLGMVGSVLAIAGLLLVALIGLLVLPVRILLKRLRKPPEVVKDA